MKQHTVIFFTLFTSIQFCHADLFSGFFGKWKQNGLSSGTNITTVYKRIENKGMKATTTIVIPGLEKGIGITRYHDNGKLDGEIKRGGVVETKLTGTWRISGKSLKTKMKQSGDLFEPFSQTTTTTLVNQNKITSITIQGGQEFFGSQSRLK